MIAVSDKWIDTQYRFLLPETHIEIDCAITEESAQKSAVATGNFPAFFSHTASILEESENVTRYATLEPNFWGLDGSHSIVADNGPWEGEGYVSYAETLSSVTLSFPAPQETAAAGVTITWGNKYEECPTVFTVSAKNSSTVVAETTVTRNNAKTSIVPLKLENYDSIEVTVHEWCLPNRRSRIEKITIGHILTLTKKDILSFTHEMHGDILSGEIPKYSIEFTMDNSDGRWDPNNPSGMEQYLSERQKLSVRYGLDVDGAIEWIPAGVFYLSEWHIPSNGLEARFVARDVFEFLLNVEMKGARNDTLEGHIQSAIRYNLPGNVPVVIDSYLSRFSGEDKGESTAAEIVQKCANASGCILRYSRDGALFVEPLNKTLTDYRITQALSYSYPEITLSKPLKSVSVKYGTDSLYDLSVSSGGEVQTVDNDFVFILPLAEKVSQTVRDALKTRQTVRGEFRADPRLDLYDVVTVESKYGALAPVVITNIKYTFNGSFRGSYEGRVLEG